MSEEKAHDRQDISGIAGETIVNQGDGNVVAKYLLVGDGTINVSEQRVAEIQNNEYAKGLEEFSKNVNEQLKGQSVAEETISSINESIDELAKEVKDIKSGQEIGYGKKINVESDS
ncbi:MAG: hypothetical protein WBX01_09170 [Nitrososphaeraceae archaeon]